MWVMIDEFFLSFFGNTLLQEGVDRGGGGDFQDNLYFGFSYIAKL